MRHESIDELEYQRLLDGTFVRAFKSHRQISVNRHTVRGGTIQNFLAHHESLFKTLANIVLIHFLGGGQCNRMTAHPGPDGKLVAFHVRHEGTVSEISSRQTRRNFVSTRHLWDSFGRDEGTDLKLWYTGLGQCGN